ncbi:uncharacterized protein M421DRAFT_425813 [Didymella exigua CBS 183.55]|uniref:Zn(2)-C6 fungal-type domain-containing protein n=1 Tax=Didymella exigua CBS 183.55 TaxID=1150837 RepID=A0A6A5R896_9PLEO|nr:uncharacterized protein M421DRAFT_425813 [Didymella exigua CBS 183.55]KAF1923440.1 hypothetical protein M421DRAFT_425813 [Didymella exigua CBS 183.55]
MDYDRGDERPRKRAKLACTNCNARRVKCDVTNRQPCRNCEMAQAVCETRESKRGKHPRKSKRDSNLDKRNRVAAPGVKVDMTPPERHEDDIAASHVLASLSTKFHSPAENQTANNSIDFQFATPRARQDSQAGLLQIGVSRPEDDAAVFLGESSSLRYVTEEEAPAPAVRPRLRHSVPNAVKAEALVPEWEAERRRKRMEALQAEGAFSFPSSDVRIALLKAFFQWFHPHFAVVDEAEIWKSHRQGTISPLLLQAMLFIGVIHCEELTLRNLGWGNRHRARYIFYIRAKDIYDASYETNKLIVLQAVFLMSFWRAGALLEKDARHWLSVAISLAQTKALHRATGDTDEKSASLKRRIWWAIYVRERQCGSALGLPNRIRDEDCDVESLTTVDFEHAYLPTTSPIDAERYKDYGVGMVQLALFLGRIVDAGYLPSRTLKPEDRAQIRDELYKWKQDLPLVMQVSVDTGDDPSFQASMLHLAFNNLLMLLYRSNFINDEDGSADIEGNIALQAAARNSRIVEDMLPRANIGHAQIHVITNLFNTLCIHVAHLRRSSGINRTLAEHRAKLCLLGLQELQKTWEVTNWVLQLFFQYLDRSTAARLAMEADDIGISSVAAPSGHATRASTPLTQHGHDVDANDIDAMITMQQMSNQQNDTGTTPWSWTTDEANQYLFSQIENDFAFGEGGMLQWSPNDLICSVMTPDFGFNDLHPPENGDLPES